MTLAVRFSIFLALLFPILVYGQISDDDHKYSMQGILQIQETGPNQEKGVPTSVRENRFVLRWNEINNEIRGIYTDAYFATSETPVTGTVINNGRSFKVQLDDVTRGVRTIEILTPARGQASGTVFSTITTKNSVGETNSSYSVPTLLSVDPTATEIAESAGPAETCVVGMGALTGYCGKYSGTITTLSDSAGNCDPILNQAQLELTSGGDFLYHVNPNIISTVPGQNVTLRHYIGSLNGNGPVSPAIDISRINCDLLPGARFDLVDRCITLRLTGSFADVAGVRSFTGTYTMEKNAVESCSLSLNLERQ